MRVLVGIPTLNGPDRLWCALASIHEHTDLSNVDIVVSDDGSPLETIHRYAKIAREFDDVPLLVTREKLGRARQWNRLVEHFPDTEICVLLADDVEVVDDWLDVLVFTLEHNPHLGVVGLRSSDARGAQPRREAKIFDGSGALVTGGKCCFAFRRSDWLAVGKFDSQFSCHEDVDFGVSLRAKRGLLSAYAEYPVVYQETSETADLGRLYAKWQKSVIDLQRDFYLPGQAYAAWSQP